MDKEALSTASKAILGTLGALGVAGAGYGGHQLGYKSGAIKATNEMASAFSDANAIENKQIADRFNLFNKKENAAIASNYMRRGMVLGAELHSKGKIKTPSEMAAMSKTSSTTGDNMEREGYLENVYNEAFTDELEKYAKLNVESAKNLLKAIGGKISAGYGATKAGVGKAYEGTKAYARKEKGALAKSRRWTGQAIKGKNINRYNAAKEAVKALKGAPVSVGAAALATGGGAYGVKKALD